MAVMPARSVSTTSGWRRMRMLSPPTYDDRCSQKTARKKDRNESNISVKKYHHSPMLGVRSDSVNCTPYVDGRNSHEPVTRYDSPTSDASVPAAAPALARTNRPTAAELPPLLRREEGACRSKARSISGGRRRTVYMERYDANESATIALSGAPAMAFAMAWRMKQLVKTLVERPTQLAMVKGLRRNL